MSNAAYIYIEEITGSCPADLHDWDHPEGCEIACGDAFWKCWKLYLTPPPQPAAPPPPEVTPPPNTTEEDE